jgi:hypothetical protein
VSNARVSSRSEASNATVSTGNLSISLLVDQSDAPALTAAAAAGEVSVVLVPGN